MELLEHMQKEVRRLDNQINKIEQEATEMKRHKKSLEKALKQLVPVTDGQNAGQAK